MKRRLLILLGAVLLVSAVTFSGWFHREPLFNGKSAHQWAQGLKDQTLKYPDAWAAFINAGTNPVPALLQEIQREETGWQTFKRAGWNKLPASVQKKIPAPRELIFSSYEIFLVNHVPNTEPDSTSIVLASLRGKRAEVRSICAWILGNVKMNSPEIVPELTKALRDPDALVRMHAADSLGARGSNAAAAVSALINIVHNDSDNGNNGPYVREAALRALGKIGPPAHEAIPTLKQTLESGNTRWTVFAAIALFRIQRDTAIAFPILTNQYPAWSDYEKWTILQTWGEMGTNAAAAVPLICDYARRISSNSAKGMFPGNEIRRESLNALERIDPAAGKKLEKEFQLLP